MISFGDLSLSFTGCGDGLDILPYEWVMASVVLITCLLVLTQLVEYHKTQPYNKRRDVQVFAMYVLILILSVWMFLHYPLLEPYMENVNTTCW